MITHAADVAQEADKIYYIRDGILSGGEETTHWEVSEQ
jgi:ABC-type lipoprotein export system ATPase subunit